MKDKDEFSFVGHRGRFILSTWGHTKAERIFMMNFNEEPNLRGDEYPVEPFENDLPDEVYYSVLELLSYAQATGHPLEEDTTVPAVQHVCRLADEGDNDARFLAARYYITNSDNDDDLERAVTWLELAVEAGHKAAIEYMKSLQEE